MNPRVQSRKVRVESWLASLSPEAEIAIEEPPAKRIRRDADVPDATFLHTYNISPPPTMDQEHHEDRPLYQTPKKAGRKRAADKMDVDEDAEPDCQITPRPPRIRRQIHPPSPKKARGKKSDSVLERLQKPFQVQPIIPHTLSENHLLADILPLYKKLMGFTDREGIIPYEIRDEVLQTGLVRNTAHYFREPDPSPGKSEQARREFAELMKIQGRAGQSQAQSRSESAWNNLVHTPVLEIVFGADILDRQNRRANSGEVHVRYEPVMSAAIVGDSIPFLKGKTGQPSEPACSYSLDSQLVGSSLSSQDDVPINMVESQDDVPINMVRSSGAKVDYVLAMDCHEDSRLRKTIFDLVNQEEDDPLTHVNQTAYKPLRYSPAAVPIEAKITTSTREPLIQLGIWTAAWYQRMYDLRERCVGAGPKPRLVSVPILQVVGHHWQAYFCCDAGTSFQVYGPISIGSTEDIVSFYILLSSLAAIKTWISETFYHSIEAWFLCDDDPESEQDHEERAGS